MGKSRGNIETRGPNTYRIRIYLGRNPDGSYKYHRETFHGTKKEAQKRLTELLRSFDTGGFVERNDMTVGEYLLYWHKTAVVPYKKPKTIQTYRQAIERMVPRIGHLKLQKLRPLDLQEYYAWSLTEGKGEDDHGNKIGRSQSTVAIDHRTVHKALEDAVIWGLLARNVADSVAAKPQSEHRTRDVWTKEETVKFLDYAEKNHRLYAYFVLALTTGMRRGELCGLRREDLHLDRLEIEIHQTIVEVEQWSGDKKKIKLVIQPTPKTDQSEAPVAISPAVAQILRSHLARQAEERLKMGSKYVDHGLVFCQINGEPLWPSRMTSYVFPKLCEKAGVRRIRLHDLRHTFITRILNERLPAQVAQRRARHTRWSTTVDMYGHITKEVEREGVEITDDILPGRSSSKSPREAAR